MIDPDLRIKSFGDELTDDEQFASLEDAKAFRSRVRAAMAETPSGFSYCCYGNAGSLSFAQTRDQVYDYETRIELTHTISDEPDSN